MLDNTVYLRYTKRVQKTNNKFARVAQWWSIALPRRGPRVRIPSRAFLLPEISRINKEFWAFVCLKSCTQLYPVIFAVTIRYNALEIRE